jgi:hypothetical protein
MTTSACFCGWFFRGDVGIAPYGLFAPFTYLM